MTVCLLTRSCLLEKTASKVETTACLDLKKHVYTCETAVCF
jgi:hypothetical protein